MKVFTTGKIAKICNVAPRTVSKWFDSGQLKGYHIPGSQDRRVPRENLIKFLKEHGMPLGELADDAVAKVLIIAEDQILVENLKRELSNDATFLVAVATSAFEAGIQAKSFHPDCVVVDFSITEVQASQLCQSLHKISGTSKTVLVALLPDELSSSTFDLSTVDESFKKPFDVNLLSMRIRTLVGAHKELAR